MTEYMLRQGIMLTKGHPFHGWSVGLVARQSDVMHARWFGTIMAGMGSTLKGGPCGG